jgi:hypothetical protein
MMKESIGNMSLCDVPEQVRSIADAFCPTAWQTNCTKLPCVLVYQSNETDQHSIYLSNGRNNVNIQTGEFDSREVQQIECVTSPALELFMHGPPYPSLITNGYARVTKELYGDVLSQHFRSSDSIWGLSLNGESIRYYPWSGTKSILSLFDITQGYDRDLYDVITDAYLPWEQQYFMNNTRVSFDSAMLDKKQVPSFVTAPIFWMNSNCDTYSNRTEYMKELMLYISVDAWGNCGRNKGPELPPEIAKIHGAHSSLSHFRGNWVSSKKAMIKHYKFTVAIENSIEHDYITEKLWQPLVAGSIPLYYGAPNVDDWLPCKDCIIDLRQFASPKAAADYIRSVSENVTLYAQFHQWRNEPVPPKFPKILDYFKRSNLYTLKGMICAMAHSKSPPRKRYEILNDIGPVF